MGGFFLVKKQASLSVITLTKNRANLLEKCLASLKGQLLSTDEIIIVDNNSRDNTRSVVGRYKQELPIRTYKTGLSGYPKLYNLAISKCTNPLLVFLDDDCIATSGFIARIRNAYGVKQDFVLQGKTMSLPRNTIFSEISERHLVNWIKANAIKGNRLQVVDNRNVAIPRVVLERVGYFSSSMKAGSEDVELGMRLVRAMVPIFYDPHMIAYHHERTTLKSFLSQHYRIAKSHAVLDNKLSEEQKVSVVNRRTWIRNLRSALELWVYYWREKRYRDIFLLPLVYSLLVMVRIVGYVRGLTD